jgi:hypothetical protein
MDKRLDGLVPLTFDDMMNLKVSDILSAEVFYLKDRTQRYASGMISVIKRGSVFVIGERRIGQWTLLENIYIKKVKKQYDYDVNQACKIPHDQR